MAARQLLRLGSDPMYSLYEHSSHGVISTGGRCEVVDGNPAACAMLGYPRAELCGMRIASLFDVEDPRFSELLGLGSGTGWVTQQLRMRRGDGSFFEAEVLLSPGVAGHDKAAGWVVFEASPAHPGAQAAVSAEGDPSALDLKVRERTRQLEALNAELAAFSSAVSHDLRAPLALVEAFSTLMLEKKDLPSQHLERVGRIQAAAAHMKEIIEALLSLTRLGQVPLQARELDLGRLVPEIALECAQMFAHRVSVTTTSELALQADPSMMRIVLGNLLSNAFKFTRDTPDPRVEVRCSPGPEGWTVVTVSDNGAGFDPAFAAGLFQPFRRLHSQAEFPGLGIGLATVHRIVQRHGGLLRAQGAVGLGASFQVFLPQAGPGATAACQWCGMNDAGQCEPSHCPASIGVRSRGQDARQLP